MPDAQLSKPQMSIVQSSSYTTSGRESRNLYNFEAKPSDNGAHFKCRATNNNQPESQAVTAEIVLSVQCEYILYRILKNPFPEFFCRFLYL